MCRDFCSFDMGDDGNSPWEQGWLHLTVKLSYYVELGAPRQRKYQIFNKIRLIAKLLAFILGYNSHKITKWRYLQKNVCSNTIYLLRQDELINIYIPFQYFYVSTLDRNFKIIQELNFLYFILQTNSFVPCPGCRSIYVYRCL